MKSIGYCFVMLGLLATCGTAKCAPPPKTIGPQPVETTKVPARPVSKPPETMRLGSGGYVIDMPVDEARFRLIRMGLVENSLLQPREGALAARVTRRSLELMWELDGPAAWVRRLKDVEDLLIQEDSGKPRRGRFSSTTVDTGNPADPVHPTLRRYYLTIPQLDPQTRLLKMIRGALILHQEERPFRLTFPFRAEGEPVTETFEGREVTLHDMKSGPLGVDFTLRYRHPPAAGRTDQERYLREAQRLQVKLVHQTKRSPTRVNTWARPRIEDILIFCSVSTPVRSEFSVQLEGSVLSDEVTRVPIVIRNLELPRPDDPRVVSGLQSTSIQDPDRKNGISARLFQAGRPAGSGILSLQFRPVVQAPRTAFGLAFIDFAADVKGRVRFPGVKPGHYQVTGEWRSDADPFGAPLSLPPVEVTVPNAGWTSLPDVDLTAIRKAAEAARQKQD